MDQRAHHIQWLFTEAAAKQAAEAGLELHFDFDERHTMPQVGDFLGFAPTTASRSRFVIREREFLWDDRTNGSAPSAVLLMLDVPEHRHGERRTEQHQPSRIARD